MKQKPFAKPFVAILTSHTNMRDEIIACLERELGEADLIGVWHTFEHTRYYEQEMGTNLKRCLVSFKRVISMDELIKIKLFTIGVEERFKVHGKRLVNIDPGYVDLNKVILASGKGGGHMIALSPCVFADFLLWYNKGWKVLPWTYPDFRDGIYFEELEKMRQSFKKRKE